MQMTKFDFYKVAILRFIEGFSACSLVMVQGDVFIYNMKHVIIASQVGISSAMFFTLLLFIIRLKNKYIRFLISGIIIALVDFLTHPSMIVNEFMEAIITGAASVLIGFIFSLFIPKVYKLSSDKFLK
jgi:predicted membrane-bound dolichyl-phosphate-mannose-protein mannosyltransferase